MGNASLFGLTESASHHYGLLTAPPGWVGRQGTPDGVRAFDAALPPEAVGNPRGAGWRNLNRPRFGTRQGAAGFERLLLNARFWSSWQIVDLSTDGGVS